MQRLFWVSFRVSNRLQVNEGFQDGGRYFPVAVPVAACRIGQFEGSSSTSVVTPPACAWETCRPSRRGLRRLFCRQEHWQQQSREDRAPSQWHVVWSAPIYSFLIFGGVFATQGDTSAFLNEITAIHSNTQAGFNCCHRFARVRIT